MAVVTSSWATLRFRRSKDVKGWALLGIPQGLYPDVMQPLFERQTRFIEKHGRGEFVNVLFEAPVALAARLALAFPAPPSCEPLVVNQAGNRLLYGKFAQSAKARCQAKESDAWPGLKLLRGDESFWQVVTTLSSVTTLPLDRLHVPGENIPARALVGEGRGHSTEGGSTTSRSRPSPAAKSALETLAKGGLQLRPAAALAHRPKGEHCGTPKQLGVDLANLDEEGFEEDEWEEEEAASLEEEAFDDIWDTDESADFWKVPVRSDPTPSVQATASSSPSFRPMGEKPGRQGKPALAFTGEGTIAAQSSVGTPPKPQVSSTQTIKNPQLPVSTSQVISSAQAQPKATAQPQRLQTKPLSTPPPTSAASEAKSPQARLPGSLAPGRYRSGLVPHPSDASSLQVYNSGGLTVGDAIARSRQQEEEAQAIAEQAQHRRIKLPFERSPSAGSGGSLPPQVTQQRPSWSYGSHAPQLPEESWAEAARPVASAIEPTWEAARHQPPEAPWTGAGASSAGGRSWQRHNPWLPPSQRRLMEAESSQYFATSELGEAVTGEAMEAVDWGYYDEQGHWIPCDPVIAAPLSLEPSVDIHGALVPAPTDIVCMPVGEEEHCPILLQGVAVWNDWRLANPHIRPNLRGAYLNNLDLAGADLHDVDLRCAFLFRADLREADLSLASLQGTDLIRADLGGASLWGAALGGAYLSHANLAGADLTQADLREVYWQGAILAGALMPDGRLFEEQY